MSTIAFWDGSRPFKNLIYGGGWEMKTANGAGMTIPGANLDTNGWVKLLPPGAKAVRALSIPVQPADIVCRWDGDDGDTMQVSDSNGAVRFRRIAGSRELRFDYTSSYAGTLRPAYLSYTVNSANYVRNIDCREDGDNPAAVFDPTFTNLLKGFSVIRFMKWQRAVEANTAVNWAHRNKPGDGDFSLNDGVPVEHMVTLANSLRADPWFAMPWNADDDYVAKFATYVRDNLDLNHRVYVEVSNEVWNGGYPVMLQAQQEGIKEGLDASHGNYGQAMTRYAEKTRHVMQIWGSVFVGQMDRLVRVASAQNVSPFWSEYILSTAGTAESVDALASAPYWGAGDEDVGGKSLDDVMDKLLPEKLSESLEWAKKQKAVANKFRKRYIAYEGGQHVWLNDREQLVAQIERDPRMYALYRAYLSRWNSEIGDTMALFTLTGGVGKAGFGLMEYQGQLEATAPKLRAVREVLRTNAR
ncbi:hypothetical protein [Sphingomonas flavescens]|uniref:hypothetical protein n=1 Tax=Sphingomonas flavescens TaxID=3132797 RepID=UPI0028041F02|nr:hypothetical protein [Sphingomonas limnosediminicola]